MKPEPYELWEENFIALCVEQLEEEPFYPYEHLWRKYPDIKQALAVYIEENPDYAEKLEDLKSSGSTSENTNDSDFLALARQLEEKKKQEELAKRIDELPSRYCPECARVLSPKGTCKCGYRRAGKRSGSRGY